MERQSCLPWSPSPDYLPDVTKFLPSWAAIEPVANERGRGRGSGGSPLEREGDIWSGDVSARRISSWAVCGIGSLGFGVKSKESSLLAASASSSFSSSPFGASRLQRSVLCFANASLNFLICEINTISAMVQNANTKIATSKTNPWDSHQLHTYDFESYPAHLHVDHTFIEQQ